MTKKDKLFYCISKFFELNNYEEDSLTISFDDLPLAKEVLDELSQNGSGDCPTLIKNGYRAEFQDSCIHVSSQSKVVFRAEEGAFYLCKPNNISIVRAHGIVPMNIYEGNYDFPVLNNDEKTLHVLIDDDYRVLSMDEDVTLQGATCGLGNCYCDGGDWRRGHKHVAHALITKDSNVTNYFFDGTGITAIPIMENRAMLPTCTANDRDAIYTKINRDEVASPGFSKMQIFMALNHLGVDCNLSNCGDVACDYICQLADTVQGVIDKNKEEIAEKSVEKYFKSFPKGVTFADGAVANFLKMFPNSTERPSNISPYFTDKNLLTIANALFLNPDLASDDNENKARLRKVCHHRGGINLDFPLKCNIAPANKIQSLYIHLSLFKENIIVPLNFYLR